jgi:hypothetical protein
VLLRAEKGEGQAMTAAELAASAALS